MFHRTSTSNSGVSEADQQALSIISLVGACVSSFFLLLIIVSYVYYQHLLDITKKLLLGLSIMLMIAMLLFAVGSEIAPGPGCQVVRERSEIGCLPSCILPYHPYKSTHRVVIRRCGIYTHSGGLGGWGADVGNGWCLLVARRRGWSSTTRCYPPSAGCSAKAFRCTNGAWCCSRTTWRC